MGRRPCRQAFVCHLDESLQQPQYRCSLQCVQAVLGFQGMAGTNTTAEDMILVRALTELLPATAGRVQVLRSFNADIQSGALSLPPVEHLWTHLIGGRHTRCRLSLHQGGMRGHAEW